MRPRVKTKAALGAKTQSAASHHRLVRFLPNYSGAFASEFCGAGGVFQRLARAAAILCRCASRCSSLSVFGTPLARRPRACASLFIFGPEFGIVEHIFDHAREISHVVISVLDYSFGRNQLKFEVEVGVELADKISQRPTAKRIDQDFGGRVALDRIQHAIHGAFGISHLSNALEMIQRGLGLHLRPLASFRCRVRCHAQSINRFSVRDKENRKLFLRRRIGMGGGGGFETVRSEPRQKSNAESSNGLAKTSTNTPNGQ